MSYEKIASGSAAPYRQTTFPQRLFITAPFAQIHRYGINVSFLLRIISCLSNKTDHEFRYSGRLWCKISGKSGYILSGGSEKR